MIRYCGLKSVEQNYFYQTKKFSGIPFTDKHIDFAQTLFKKQYPGASGLLSTLLQYIPLPMKLTTGIQIIYCHGYHWVAAYKEDRNSDVEVYDLYLICKWYCCYNSTASTIKVVPIQKQSTGSNNCGLFAIAVCMALLLNETPRQVMFDENRMCFHLAECFEKKFMTSFPFILQWLWII